MAAGFKILGDDGATNVGVTANKEMQVRPTTTVANAGFVFIAASPDNIGFRSYSTQGSMSVGPRHLAFFDPIDGAVVNTNLWTTSVTGAMAIAVASGTMTLNSGAITTINTAAQITGTTQIQFVNTYPPCFRALARINTVPEPNATIELGTAVAAGLTAPTDGCFFRWNSSAEFRAVVNFGGVETQSAALTAPTIDTIHKFQVLVKGTSVVFSIDEVIVATVTVPATQATPTSTSRYAPFARVINGASVPTTAPQLGIAAFIVFQADIDKVKPWSESMAGLGRGSYQSPVTTFNQTSNWTNSTAPVSASLSNTVAGYTTLGGLGQFAAPASAATDFVLYGYQVPAGFQLHITRINIASVNTGAAVATTATIIQWGCAVNSSAVSLATTESPPTSWQPRRVPLGFHTYLVGAAIGTQAPDINREYGTPLVVDSLRFFQVIATVFLGTATGSQVIRVTVAVEGYFQ